MKNISIALTLLFVSLCCGISPAKSQTPIDPNKTQVVIIGTLHGKHYESSKYKPEVLKEIILSLKPDTILNELPLSLVDPNGRPIFRHYLQGPEGWAADTAAMQLGIKQIPFDQPDRQENFKKTNYFKREKQSNESTQKWAQQIGKEDPNSIDLKILQLCEYAGDAQAKMWEMNLGPEAFNSELFDLIIRIKHSVWRDISGSIFKKYPGYESLVDDCKFFRDQWLERNKIMAENIKKAAKEYPGKRLVVITGGEHRYILRDLLKNESCIDLKEYWELINFDVDKCLASTAPPKDLGMSAEGIAQEQAAVKIVTDFWQAVIKGNWVLAGRLCPPKIKDWQQIFEKNPPVELIKVEKPSSSQLAGPHVNFNVQCTIRFKNGQTKNLINEIGFRKVGGKTVCFIFNVPNLPRKW